MGSRIVENSNLKSNMISFGNPCKEYKENSLYLSINANDSWK